MVKTVLFCFICQTQYQYCVILIIPKSAILIVYIRLYEIQGLISSNRLCHVDARRPVVMCVCSSLKRAVFSTLIYSQHRSDLHTTLLSCLELDWTEVLEIVSKRLANLHEADQDDFQARVKVHTLIVATGSC